VDTNGDSRVTEADGTALLFLDLRRGIEALLVPASRFVSGVDWAPSSGDFFIYSALPGGGGGEDLFIIEYNGQNDRNLTCQTGAQCDPTLRERRPRLDALESVATFQRVDTSGRSVVAIFSGPANQPALTSGPGDFDPVFSPDNRRVAFRRLTSADANDGLGSHDIMSVAVDGTGLQVLASGEAFRGAPDWSPQGLAWVEADASSTRLVVAGADGGSPGTIVTLPAGTALSNPRWLQPE
jgi:Tol biopolymer transport system component